MWEIGANGRSPPTRGGNRHAKPARSVRIAPVTGGGRSRLRGAGGNTGTLRLRAYFYILTEKNYSLAGGIRGRILTLERVMSMVIKAPASSSDSKRRSASITVFSILAGSMS